MKVKKIINNNVALVDRGGHESIIYLTGVAFKKKVGQHISDSEVEKTFVLDSQDRLEHFSYLLSRADDQLILLVNELVQYGEKEIGKSANDYLYLALLDHLSFALKRAKKRSIFEESIDLGGKKILSQLLQNWVRSLGKDQSNLSSRFS